MDSLMIHNSNTRITENTITRKLVIPPSTARELLYTEMHLDGHGKTIKKDQSAHKTQNQEENEITMGKKTFKIS